MFIPNNKSTPIDYRVYVDNNWCLRVNKYYIENSVNKVLVFNSSKLVKLIPKFIMSIPTKISMLWCYWNGVGYIYKMSILMNIYFLYF